MRPAEELQRELQARNLLDLARQACASAGCELAHLSSRNQEGSRARRALYRAMQAQGWTASAMGRLVGLHHSTVIQALQAEERAK